MTRGNFSSPPIPTRLTRLLSTRGKGKVRNETTTRRTRSMKFHVEFGGGWRANHPDFEFSCTIEYHTSARSLYTRSFRFIRTSILQSFHFPFRYKYIKIVLYYPKRSK